MFKSLSKINDTYLKMSIAKKSVIWFTIATIIQNGIQFIITPIYTRILSENEYGIYSVFQSWQQIFSIIAVLALDRCITVGFMKFSKEKKEFLSSVQTLMTVLVFISSLVVFAFSDFFVDLINLPLYMIMSMLVVSLMNNSLSNWSWYQRYNYNYRKLTSVTVLSTLLIQIIAVLSISYLPFENKGNILVMSTSAARLLMYGVIYLSVIKNGRTTYRKKFWGFSLKYSIAVIPHALAQIILNSSDRIMIDEICGRNETAFYSVTYSSAMVLNTIMISISSAVQPWFFEKIRDNDFAKIKKVTNYLLIFAACLSVFVSLFAPEILNIMAPSSYSAAIWIFPSIAGSVYFNSMYLYFANFESYFEKPIYFSIATTTGAIVNIVLNFIFIPIFGFVAAGYTTLFCYILFSVMHYIFMRKICNENIGGIKVFDLKFIIILSIIVLILTLLITVLYKYTYIRYFIIVCIVAFIMFKLKFIINTARNLIK